MNRLVDNRSPWATQIPPKQIHQTTVCSPTPFSATCGGVKTSRNWHSLSPLFLLFPHASTRHNEFRDCLFTYSKGQTLWKCSQATGIGCGSIAVDWGSFCRDMFTEYQAELRWTIFVSRYYRPILSADKNRSSVIKNPPIFSENQLMNCTNSACTIFLSRHFGNPALWLVVNCGAALFTMQSEWLNEDVTQLIYLYEQNALLWDPNCPKLHITSHGEQGHRPQRPLYYTICDYN